MRKTLAELSRSTGRIFVVWWLASFAGVFVYFTGIVQWALGEALGSTLPEVLRVSLGGGLAIVGVVGVVLSLLHAVDKIRIERDTLRASIELTPRAELRFVFNPDDPVSLPQLPKERFREHGIIRIGLSNGGTLRAKGVRVAVAWTDPLGDPVLTGYRLHSYLSDETEFEIPCDPMGAPTAYAHIGQVLRNDVETILLQLGHGFQTRPAPVIRIGLRMEHDTGVCFAVLTFRSLKDLKLEIEFTEGNQLSSPTISSTSQA